MTALVAVLLERAHVARQEIGHHLRRGGVEPVLHLVPLHRRAERAGERREHAAPVLVAERLVDAAQRGDLRVRHEALQGAREPVRQPQRRGRHEREPARLHAGLPPLEQRAPAAEQLAELRGPRRVDARQRPVLRPHDLARAGLHARARLGEVRPGRVVEEGHRHARREGGADQVDHLLLELLPQDERRAQVRAREAEQGVRPVQRVEAAEVERAHGLCAGREDADALHLEGVEDDEAPPGGAVRDDVAVDEVAEPLGRELVVERARGLEQRVARLLVRVAVRGLRRRARRAEQAGERARRPLAERAPRVRAERLPERLAHRGLRLARIQPRVARSRLRPPIERDEERGHVGAQRAPDRRVARAGLGDAARLVHAARRPGAARRGRDEGRERGDVELAVRDHSARRAGGAEAEDHEARGPPEASAASRGAGGAGAVEGFLDGRDVVRRGGVGRRAGDDQVRDPQRVPLALLAQLRARR